MSSATEHQQLVNEILVALSARGVLCWPIPTGMARTATGAVIRFGGKGHGDIGGVIPPNGRALSIEVKTGRAREERHQRTFGSVFAGKGGIRVVARSVDDALMAVDHSMGSASTVGWRA